VSDFLRANLSTAGPPRGRVRAPRGVPRSEFAERTCHIGARPQPTPHLQHLDPMWYYAQMGNSLNAPISSHCRAAYHLD